MPATDTLAAPAMGPPLRHKIMDKHYRQSGELTLCTREADVGTGKGTISVRLATCEGQRTLATHLINRMYSWRGYGADHQLSSGENCATFTACCDEDVVGTLTLAVDSSDGLAADRSFRQELDVFRSTPEAKLCELRTFAFNSDLKSKYALATLFHTIFAYEAQSFGCTDVFIEVNPRHVRFYEVMLAFKPVGLAKLDDSVTWWPSHVPVQLMRLNLADMRRYIDQYSGGSVKQRHSLYPYFFSKCEERALLSRLTAMAEAATSPSEPEARWS